MVNGFSQRPQARAPTVEGNYNAFAPSAESSGHAQHYNYSAWLAAKFQKKMEFSIRMAI